MTVKCRSLLYFTCLLAPPPAPPSPDLPPHEFCSPFSPSYSSSTSPSLPLPNPPTTHSSSPYPTTPPPPATSYVLAVLSSSSLPARSVYYDVYINYPRHCSIILSPSQCPTLAFDLVQEIYPGEPYADAAAEVLPTFHAYAYSGAAADPVAYSNYGRLEDFAALRAAGVNVTGAVALARYGQIYREDIIKNAEDAGAVAAVVFTNDKDYGGGERGRFPEGRGCRRAVCKWGARTGDLRPDDARVGERHGVRRGGERWRWRWRRAGWCRGSHRCRCRLGTGRRSLRPSGDRWWPTIGRAAKGALLYRLEPGLGFLNLTYIVS